MYYRRIVSQARIHSCQHRGENMPVTTRIGPASTVTMHFSLTLEDGTVAESSLGNEPLRFVMGDGTLVRGLELALYGMRPGERQRLVLTPEQAFGARHAANIHRLLRRDFPPDIVPEPGLVVGFTTPEGEEIGGMILEVMDDEVRVDFNHPLAGHAITYEVEILSVEPPREPAPSEV
jgi:FKBP-type peptidyl-prolyl cis-trans isomerase SlpA